MRKFLCLIPALLLAVTSAYACHGKSSGQASNQQAACASYGQQGGMTYIDPNPPGIQQDVYTTSYGSYAVDNGSGNTAKRVRHFRLFGRRRCH